MKINWGKGIVIAIALFMCFILYFVVKVQSDTQYDNEMVTEQYYKKEKLVQGNIESIQNANSLTEKVAITKTVNGVVVNFPKEFDYSKIKGKVRKDISILHNLCLFKG